jgi:hypothetical protein
LGTRYDGSPVIVPDGSVPPPDEPNHYVPSACPGGRAPHAWLPDGRSLFDTFNFEWTLLALGPQPPDNGAFTRSNIDLKVVHHASPKLRELYEADLALIRPDQIVAWRGNDGRQADEILKHVIGFGDGALTR